MSIHWILYQSPTNTAVTSGDWTSWSSLVSELTEQAQHSLSIIETYLTDGGAYLYPC
jgi:hypothetical protein